MFCCCVKIVFFRVLGIDGPELFSSRWVECRGCGSDEEKQPYVELRHGVDVCSFKFSVLLVRPQVLKVRRRSFAWYSHVGGALEEFVSVFGHREERCGCVCACVRACV